jgi:hypothetical protein
MRLPPSPRVIGSPGSQFEALRHIWHMGDNMPKDVREAEKHVQRLRQGSSMDSPGGKVG